MGWSARGRIKDWMLEFARWSQVAWKEHDEVNDHGDYYLGVIMGIRDAKSHRRGGVAGLEDEVGQGYQDARLLINKVLQLGDAPEGDFYELLAKPYSEPLHSRPQQEW